MSLHISLVSIQGNHLSEIAGVLEDCEYIVEDSFTVKSGDQVSEELGWNPDRNRVAKAAYFAHGWTYIIDPELVLLINDVWLKYSRKWNNRIFGWICEGVSGTYGITVFDSGNKRRVVVSVDGEVVTDEGKPLKEETDLDWNDVWETDILGLAKRIGAVYDFPADRDYQIIHLDESQISAP